MTPPLTAKIGLSIFAKTLVETFELKHEWEKFKPEKKNPIKLDLRAFKKRCFAAQKRTRFVIICLLQWNATAKKTLRYPEEIEKNEHNWDEISPDVPYLDGDEGGTGVFKKMYLMYDCYA